VSRNFFGSHSRYSEIYLKGVMRGLPYEGRAAFGLTLNFPWPSISI
jgi:hypothetical protein